MSDEQRWINEFCMVWIVVGFAEALITKSRMTAVGALAYHRDPRRVRAIAADEVLNMYDDEIAREATNG